MAIDTKKLRTLFADDAMAYLLDKTGKKWPLAMLLDEIDTLRQQLAECRADTIDGVVADLRREARWREGQRMRGSAHYNAIANRLVAKSKSIKEAGK